MILRDAEHPPCLSLSVTKDFLRELLVHLFFSASIALDDNFNLL